MATSGTTNWKMKVNEIVEEASKIARANPANPQAALGPLSADDARNARTALNRCLTDISNKGPVLSQLAYKQQLLTQGTASYVLDQTVSDIWDVTYSKFDSATSTYTEQPMTRFGIDSYNQLNNKTIQSRPSQYAIVREVDTPRMYIYPTADTSAVDYINYWAITRVEDVNAANQDIDVPFSYTNVLISGTAYYLSLSNPYITESRVAMLKTIYDEDMENAFGEDVDKVSLYLIPFSRRY